ncbi:MAG: zinc-ribbon domain-containing protein [Deltaproteobacteria bacterium]|nr:zinc-ribbon domain-containing protein [Deltaproteobacteria bacterium]
MIVTCPRCLTKFNLPDDKVGHGAKLQLHCSRCGWDFLFSPLEVELEDNDSAVAPAANVDDVFELSDDFDEEPEVSEASEGTADDEDVAFLTEELEARPAAASQVKTSAPAPESEASLEELALDLDDLDGLDLDDIEFESFGDELETAGMRPTKLDDDGELDELLKQVGELPEQTATLKVEPGHHKDVQKGRQESTASLSSAARKNGGTGATRRNFILVFCCFLIMSLALWAAYGLWQRFSIDMRKYLKLVAVENQRLRLPSDRIVIVLRGKVVNDSPRQVSDLRIKGVLLDEAGLSVAEVVTAGGVSFSTEELDQLDAAKLALLENPAAVVAPEGGELPFMIAFYDYPEKARECYVEISSFQVKKGPRLK